jgi:uncharacterized OsmC-like protein
MTPSSIKAAIDSLSGAINADPDKARAKATPATARLVDGLQSEVTGPKGERILTDMPRAMGGEGSSPNPGWYLRAAMASCTTSVIAMHAAKRGIRLDSLEVTVESEGDNRGILGMDEKVSAGYSELRMKVKIASSSATEAELRELTQFAEAHSPVGCTIEGAPPRSLAVEVVKARR